MYLATEQLAERISTLQLTFFCTCCTQLVKFQLVLDDSEDVSNSCGVEQQRYVTTILTQEEMHRSNNASPLLIAVDVNGSRSLAWMCLPHPCSFAPHTSDVTSILSDLDILLQLETRLDS
jgi:hypothetical protein